MSASRGFAYVAILATASLLLTAVPARAGTLNAVVGLHAGSSPAVPASKACLPANTGVQDDCYNWNMEDSDFTAAGMTTRYALVVELAGDGVGGLSCGIEYSTNLFVGFDLCTDGIEFPNNHWPASGGGNRITWTTCGASLDPNYANRYAVTANWLQVVFGSFYVYTYGGDGFFKITENPLGPGTEDDELAVESCDGVTDFLYYLAGGRIGIGECQGYNPCHRDPPWFEPTSPDPNGCPSVPVASTTWGGVKSRYAAQEEGNP